MPNGRNPYASSRACAERLEAAGCPMDSMDTFRDDPELVIESVPGLERTRVFELSNGLTGYVIDVRISNKLGRPIYKPTFDLTLPWNDVPVRWIEEALHPKLKIYDYFFPSELTLWYDEQTLLLNGRSGKGKLAHGDCLEGLLLGEGWEPIPEQYRHGGLVSAVFSVINAIGTTFQSPVKLYVDRSNRSQKKFSAKGRCQARRPLFSERYVELPAQPLGARLSGLEDKRRPATCGRL